MPDKIRVAVAGLGFMGSTHLKAYSELPGVQVAAVASTDCRKLKRDFSEIQGNLGRTVAQIDFSGVRGYSDYRQAIHDDAVDAVDLCVPLICMRRWPSRPYAWENMCWCKSRWCSPRRKRTR